MLQELTKGIPGWAQKRAKAHPHLPFWSRIHSALEFIVKFDPDDHEVVACGTPLNSSAKRAASQLSVVDLTGHVSDSSWSDADDDVVCCDERGSPLAKKVRRKFSIPTANRTTVRTKSSSSSSSSTAPHSSQLAATASRASTFADLRATLSPVDKELVTKKKKKKRQQREFNMAASTSSSSSTAPHSLQPAGTASLSIAALRATLSPLEIVLNLGVDNSSSVRDGSDDFRFTIVSKR